MACFNIFDIFNIILHRACSMQHESSTSSTYIALQPLGVFDLSSTCFNIHSILYSIIYTKSQLLKTFCGLKIGWILRKLRAKMCVYVLFPSLTSLTDIALQPLGVFDLSLTSLTCFNIHSIWWYGWKAVSLSFSKLFVNWKSVEY